jgi:hypothetical protein
MERRNRSLEALNKLTHIDSLDNPYDKGYSLQLWTAEYLDDNFLENLDLEIKDLKLFSELFYKNINFLKEHKIEIAKELNRNKNIKKFLQ